MKGRGRQQLLLSTTVLAAIAAYGRRAYAACVNTVGSTYECSGVTVRTVIIADDAAVTTVSGFSIDTSSSGGRTALTITGDGAISYTDENASPLTAGVSAQEDNALTIRSTGDIASGNVGSVTVVTDGVLWGAEHGIEARNDGSGTLSITANGDVTGGVYGYSHGISARNSGTDLSVTTGTGTEVSGYSGVHARHYGSGTLSITANGDLTGTNVHGINALGYGSLTVITAAGTTVSGDLIGIFAASYGSGAITITANGDVAGTNGAGIQALAYNGSQIEITVNSAGTVTGASSAIRALTGPADVTIAGAIVGGTTAAIQFDNGNDRLELHPTFAISGNVLAAGGTDTLAFGGSGSGAFDLGDIGAQYQSFEAFEVDSGAWSFSGVTAVGFDVNGGTVMGTGTFGDVILFAGGTIAPGNSIGTLTVDGDFTSEGGTLEIEVELGDDSSATDLLVITGNALLGTGGATEVEVINLGGLGAQTTNGIRIVDVQGATSEAGVFALADPVIAGAYSYDLFQGGVSGVGDPDDGDWYLRSSGFVSTAGTYEAYPAAFIGLIDLPTLGQRVGDRHAAAGGGGYDLSIGEDTGDPGGRSLWTRIEAAHGHVEGDSTTDVSYDQTRYLVQVGVDGQFVDDGGVLIGGLNLQYGRSDADISSASGDGDSTTDSYGGGATLTWYGDDGVYVDGQAAVAWLLGDLSSDDSGAIVEDNEGWGYAVSIEAGRKVPLAGGLSATPQAQLSYTSVDFDDFTDPFGSTVSLESGDSLKGRIGVAFDYETSGAAGRGRVYTVANLIYEFLGGTAVDVDGDELAFEPDALVGEAGVGGTYAWGRYAVRGEALAQGSLEGSYGFKGTAEVRAMW